MQICIQNNFVPAYKPYQYNSANKRFSDVAFQPKLQCDTVSFTAKKDDFLSLPISKILKKVKESVNREHLIGGGAEGVVYQIDGTEYCLKLSRFGDSVDTLPEYFSKNVSEEDKINHVVAHLGRDSVLMKRIDGVSVFDINNYSADVSFASAEKLLEFPNSSYRDLLTQVIKATKYGMEYDCHGGNLIIDFEKEKFTAIDFYPSRKSINEEVLSKIYQPFTSLYSFGENSKRMLGKKIMYMLLDEFKPNVKPEIDFKDVDVYSFMCDLTIDGTIKTNRLLGDIDKSFNSLVELKNRELAGEDVTKELIAQRLATAKLVDKCFYNTNPTQNISFTGRKIPLLDLPKDEVLKLVKQSISPKNGIGIGGEADVYAIPNTDYCVRVIGQNGDSRHFATRFKDYTTEFSKDLTPQEEVNHVVIRLGNGASIMKRIVGEPVYSFFRTQEEQLSAAKEVANFPVEAFSNLLRQMSKAGNAGVGFDPHAANVIADFENKTLTAIDFQEYRCRTLIKPLESMLNGLRTVDDDEINLTLLKKVLKAGLEEFKPGVKPCFDVERFNFVRILANCCNEPEDTRFYSLAHFKSLELKGRDVADKLQCLVKDLTEKIDNLTVFTRFY